MKKIDYLFGRYRGASRFYTFNTSVISVCVEHEFLRPVRAARARNIIEVTLVERGAYMYGRPTNTQ